MINQEKILRIPETLERLGTSKTNLYDKVNEGLFTSPVKILGKRAVGFAESEVDAILTFVIAGKSDDELRGLVRLLNEERQRKAEKLIKDLTNKTNNDGVKT